VSRWPHYVPRKGMTKLCDHLYLNGAQCGHIIKVGRDYCGTHAPLHMHECWCLRCGGISWHYIRRARRRINARCNVCGYVFSQTNYRSEGPREKDSRKGDGAGRQDGEKHRAPP
jgi:hypothetical protein